MLAWQEVDLTTDPDEALYQGDPADLVDARRLLSELLNQPAWMADAACREHPEVQFFVERGEDVRPAKAVCNSCLVHDECLAYALDQGSHLAGIWGGTSDRQRRRRRKEKSVTPLRVDSEHFDATAGHHVVTNCVLPSPDDMEGDLSEPVSVDVEADG